MWLYLWFFTKKHSVRAFIWIRSLNYILNVDPKSKKKPWKIAKKRQNDPEWPWIWFQKITRQPDVGLTALYHLSSIFRWGTHLCMSLFLSIRLLHTISQEPYIIWFLVHMCKMMISPGVLFIFLNFDFLGC